MEILAQSADGYLYVFDLDGVLIDSPSIGTESWIAPAFIRSFTFHLRPEIIACNPGQSRVVGRAEFRGAILR